MVSAQERLTRTFTRSSHTYTRTERTEISKTRGGETKREVRVEESTQVGGDPFPAVFGDFLGRERLGSFGSITRQQEGEQSTGNWGPHRETGASCFVRQNGPISDHLGLDDQDRSEQRRGVAEEGGHHGNQIQPLIGLTLLQPFR